MAENSKIEWTHHTFNPWRGCTKVSAGCAHCYAETMSHRNPGVLGVWGPTGTRVVASEAMWGEPVRWNAAAVKAGERHRVFCASLADVFEGGETMPADSREAVKQARARLFDLIARTPGLDWLLLTKRPINVNSMVRRVTGGVEPERWFADNPHVWVGTSVENQAAADERIPHLLRVPTRVRFLSMEPLLGPVNLSPWVDPQLTVIDRPQRLDWVIVGGESGPDARPMHPDWVRSLRDQCVAAGVPFFMKQHGEWFPSGMYDLDTQEPPLGGRPEVYVGPTGQVIRTASPFEHGAPCCVPSGFVSMVRVGKKAAGRLLDGREWNELPAAEGERRCRECGINRPAGESNCPVCLDAKTRKAPSKASQ